MLKDLELPAGVIVGKRQYSGAFDLGGQMCYAGCVKPVCDRTLSQTAKPIYKAKDGIRVQGGWKGAKGAKYRIVKKVSV